MDPTLRRLRPIATAALVATLALPGAPALSAQSAADGEGAAALEAASERFATITAFCADFEQELEVTLLRQTNRSHGRLCQRRPNLFSMRFAEPEGDEIVADGEFFWIRLASEAPDQVVQIPMADRPGGFDFYREFLEDPFEVYTVLEAGSEVVDGVATHAVRLEPRNPVDWRLATVWIDPAEQMIRKVSIVETNGSIRRILLSAIDLSPDLAPDFFDYQPPEGTTVVTVGGAPKDR